jgi:hypothetical protein
VLTTQFGDRLYGHCFTRHVPVAPERRQELLPDTDDSSHYFEPIALVILSFHPFHNSFARILIDFGRYRWTRSIDSSTSYFCDSVDLLFLLCSICFVCQRS